MFLVIFSVCALGILFCFMMCYLKMYSIMSNGMSSMDDAGLPRGFKGFFLFGFMILFFFVSAIVSIVFKLFGYL